jgi:hypothetical protein
MNALQHCILNQGLSAACLLQRLLAYEITETQNKSIMRTCLTETILVMVLSFQTDDYFDKLLQANVF